MFKVKQERTVNRPVDDVFDYVADLRNEMEWNPGARSVTRVDEGPIQEGARFAASYQGAGELAIRILEYQRPRLLRYLSEGRFMRFTSIIEVAPAGSGATVSLSMEVSPLGPLKLAQPLMALTLKRQFSTSADRLAAALDAGRG